MQTLSQDRIAQLAYQLWQERGCPEGSPEVDWERACRMLESAAPPDNEVLSAPAAAPQGFASSGAIAQERLDDAVGTSRPKRKASARPVLVDGADTSARTTRPRKGRSSSGRPAI
jgi:hypothetical protein